MRDGAAALVGAWVMVAVEGGGRNRWKKIDHDLQSHKSIEPNYQQLYQISAGLGAAERNLGEWRLQKIWVSQALRCSCVSAP